MVFLKDDPGRQEYMEYMQNELEKLDHVIKEIVYEISITIMQDDQIQDQAGWWMCVVLLNKFRIGYTNAI